MKAPAFWWWGTVICAVCDKTHAAVCPVDSLDEEPAPGQECPFCGSMSCVIAPQLGDPEDYDRGF